VARVLTGASATGWTTAALTALAVFVTPMPEAGSSERNLAVTTRA